MKERIDQLLVKENFFDSRTKSQRAIEDGRVFADGKLITKSGELVSVNAQIEIVGENLKFVSRGGLKLEKAIKEFGIKFEGKTVLDIGSSTGGFTDCALQHGAKKVFAVDVGKNQLHSSLKNDSRVISLENCDIRKIDKSIFSETEIIVCDVSFISIFKVFSEISEFLQNEMKIIVLIKPQFECGKELAKKYKGVVTNKQVRSDVVSETLKRMNEIGFICEKITESPVLGGDGNVEFLCLFKKQ